MPEVAVAVISFQTREQLRACLASLEGQAAAPEGRAEVWVVDNGSTDGSPEMVREQFAWARLVEPGANLGYGAAVNLVAARTDTPWLAAANADVALEPGALEALLRAGREDPGAGAVAPRLILPDGRTEHGVHPFPGLLFTAAFALGLTRPFGDQLCLEGAWDPERPRRVPWAIGAFLLLRREAWQAAGGFDERQWLFAEDLDLGWRLRRAGWATRYEPSARVRHTGSAATGAAFGDERTERWQLATYAWLLRRRGVVVTRLTALLNVLGAAARAALTRDQSRRRIHARWARLHARTGLLTARHALRQVR
ncbi:MAG TPA: glycosyltransferase family 2 protein [Solirubrobacteraceae bacterium]|nr:glycosyltransferase family 2 protein [Solirubrobacteraceae bacterium]